MTTMTATEVARSFSEVLNRVGSGEEIEIVRNGAPVAVLTQPRVTLLPASRLRALLATLPPVDDAFVDDLRAIRRSVGPLDDPWAS